jgi:hypothetical protein
MLLEKRNMSHKNKKERIKKCQKHKTWSKKGTEMEYERKPEKGGYDKEKDN